MILSTRVNVDFEKVEVAAGLACTCGAQLRPLDFAMRLGRIEAVCGGCHSMLLSLEKLDPPSEDD
jgi:hypothetical protein